jgi:hypothetical protein
VHGHGHGHGREVEQMNLTRTKAQGRLLLFWVNVCAPWACYAVIWALYNPKPQTKKLELTCTGDLELIMIALSYLTFYSHRSSNQQLAIRPMEGIGHATIVGMYLKMTIVGMNKLIKRKK